MKALLLLQTPAPSFHACLRSQAFRKHFTRPAERSTVRASNDWPAIGTNMRTSKERGCARASCRGVMERGQWPQRSRVAFRNRRDSSVLTQVLPCTCSSCHARTRPSSSRRPRQQNIKRSFLSCKRSNNLETSSCRHAWHTSRRHLQAGSAQHLVTGFSRLKLHHSHSVQALYRRDVLAILISSLLPSAALAVLQCSASTC